MIDVSQAKAGMVLASDVLDKRGRVLIPAGKELIEKYVTALPAWGVTQIEVEGEGLEGGTIEVEPWAVEEATAELEKAFVRTNRAHPALAALFDVCVTRRASALQTERGSGE